MKLIKTLGFIICYATFFGQDNTILKIDDQTVNKTEFEQIYWKNKKEKIATKEDLDEYIQLFINFKLKVKEAESLGMDTVPSFVKELSGYRKQLANPYLLDNEAGEKLVKEAESNAEADQHKRDIIEARNKLDNEIYQIGKLLDEHKFNVYR